MKIRDCSLPTKIFYFILIYMMYFIYVLLLPIGLIVSEMPIQGMILLFVEYGGMIFLALFSPMAFWINLVMLSIYGLVFTYMVYREEQEEEDSIDQESAYENTSGDSYRTYNGYWEYFARKKDIFFAGMSKTEAKKEYRRLMKQYHPDNAGGDTEMTKRISEAYNEYKEANGE